MDDVLNSAFVVVASCLLLRSHFLSHYTHAGKTIQAIALLAYLMEFKQNLGPYVDNFFCTVGCSASAVFVQFH